MGKRKEVWNYTKRRKGKKQKKGEQDSISEETPPNEEVSRTPSPPTNACQENVIDPEPNKSSSIVENGNVKIKREPTEKSSPKPKRMCSTALLPAHGMLESEKVKDTDKNAVKIKSEPNVGVAAPRNVKQESAYEDNEEEVEIIGVLKPVKRTIQNPVENWSEDIILLAESLIQKEPEEIHDPVAVLLQIPATDEHCATAPSSPAEDERILQPEEVEFSILLKSEENETCNLSSQSGTDTSLNMDVDISSQVVYSTGVCSTESSSQSQDNLALLQRYFELKSKDSIAEWMNCFEICNMFENLNFNSVSTPDLNKNISQCVEKIMLKSQKAKEIVEISPKEVSVEMKKEKVDKSNVSLFELESQCPKLIPIIYPISQTENHKEAERLPDISNKLESCEKMVVDSSASPAATYNNGLVSQNTSVVSHSTNSPCQKSTAQSMNAEHFPPQIYSPPSKSQIESHRELKQIPSASSTGGLCEKIPTDHRNITYQNMAQYPTPSFPPAQNEAASIESNFTSRYATETCPDLNQIPTGTRRNYQANATNFRNIPQQNMTNTYPIPSVPPARNEATSIQKNFTSKDATDFLNKTFNSPEFRQYSKYDNVKNVINEQKAKKINVQDYMSRIKTNVVNDPRLKNRQVASNTNPLNFTSSISPGIFSNKEHTVIPGLDLTQAPKPIPTIHDILNSIKIPSSSTLGSNINQTLTSSYGQSSRGPKSSSGLMENYFTESPKMHSFPSPSSEHSTYIPGISSNRFSDNPMQSPRVDYNNLFPQNISTVVSVPLSRRLSSSLPTNELPPTSYDRERAVRRSVSLLDKNLKDDIGRNIIDSTSVYLIIVEWNIDWFAEYEKIQRLPPILPAGISPSQVRNTYRDSKDYYATYFKLLLMDCWYKIYTAWKVSDKERFFVGKIMEYETKNDCNRYVIEFFVPKHESEHMPKNNYIVLLRFTSLAKESVTMLAYATKVLSRPFEKQYDTDHEAFKAIQNSNYYSIMKYKMFSLTVFKSDDIDTKELVLVKKLNNVRKYLLFNDALSRISTSPLCSFILAPITSENRQNIVIPPGHTEPARAFNVLCDKILNEAPVLATIHCTWNTDQKIRAVFDLVNELKARRRGSKVLICAKSEKTLVAIGNVLLRLGVQFSYLNKDRIAELQSFSLARQVEELLKGKVHDEHHMDRKKEEAQFDVLRKCDVFLLSILGVDPETALLTKGHDVSCCILDEAHYCTEPESIIPLFFGIKKFILMGNKGLSCEVSPITSSFEYNRSLFNRAAL